MLKRIVFLHHQHVSTKCIYPNLARLGHPKARTAWTSQSSLPGIPKLARLGHAFVSNRVDWALLVCFLSYGVKSRSGHDRSQSFGSISHALGPKFTFWGNTPTSLRIYSKYTNNPTNNPKSKKYRFSSGLSYGAGFCSSTVHLWQQHQRNWQTISWWWAGDKGQARSGLGPIWAHMALMGHMGPLLL